MDKVTVEKIVKVMKEYSKTSREEYTINFIEDKESMRKGHNFMTYSGSKKPKQIHEIIIISDALTDTRYELFFIQWSETRPQDQYIVIFASGGGSPIGEMYKVDNMCLKWHYIAKKQGEEAKRNPDRREYFAKRYGSTEVHIEIPKSVDDVREFIEELFKIANITLMAGQLKSTDQIPKSTNYHIGGFPEGKSIEKIHKARERNSKVIRLAKESRAKEFKVLTCDVCGFDFEKMYGEIGSMFIEAHHTIPVSELKEGDVTKLEDIALVCSNCHRMLHRRRPWLKIDEIKNLIKMK